MDDATEELYLQKIEEFVHDGDLIISTEMLCRKLNIPINDAKHLINKYLTDHRDIKPKELGVHYVILGRLAKENTFCVLLVAEADLDDKLSLFKSGYSKDIYSVQKARNTDINALNLINVEPREKALIGSITGKNCVASKKLVSKPIILDTQKKKIEPTKRQKISNVEKKPNLDENIFEKKTSPTKLKITNRPVQNNKGIASFFSKMAEKPEMPDKKQPMEENNKNGREILQKKIETPKEHTQISKETNKSNVTKPLNKLIDTDDESDDCKVIAPEKESVNNKSKKQTHTSTKKGSKKRSRKEDDPPEKSQKRRKRVVDISDSDDDIFGKASEDEDTDLRSSGDEAPPEPVVKPPRTDLFSPKNKQKKLLDKSYVDEEGYMVTKKEWVEISGSEDDEQEQEMPKLPITKQPKTSKKEEEKKGQKQVEEKRELAAAKGKGKNAKKVANQPSILSFFSKK